MCRGRGDGSGTNTGVSDQPWPPPHFRRLLFARSSKQSSRVCLCVRGGGGGGGGQKFTGDMWRLTASRRHTTQIHWYMRTTHACLREIISISGLSPLLSLKFDMLAEERDPLKINYICIMKSASEGLLLSCWVVRSHALWWRRRLFAPFSSWQSYLLLFKMIINCFIVSSGWKTQIK